MLAGQGYPHRGDRLPDLDASDVIGTATLRAAGYNVLTCDPRGLGGSGGTVMFNSPDFEGRDVSAWIDFAAAQPETLLDSAGDPRELRRLLWWCDTLMSAARVAPRVRGCGTA